MERDHKICETCGEVFYRPLVRASDGKHFYPLSVTLWSKRRYCSNRCIPTVGRPNEKHHAWKGENVGYSPLHRWIKRHFGRPTECSSCGKPNVADGRSVIAWASKDHQYTRNADDWLPLCYKCHADHDRAHKLRFAA